MGLFSDSPPFAQMWWNGTRFMQVTKQPHEQCRCSDGYSLCLSTGTCSLLGAVTGFSVIWVVELQRDPRAPLSCIIEFAQDNRIFWDTTLVMELQEVYNAKNNCL